MYPEGLEFASAYLESRSNNEDILFFGLQYYIKEYLLRNDFIGDLELLNSILSTHFNIDMNLHTWRNRFQNLDELGYLPLNIYAVDEGTVVPSKNVLMKVENTHKDFAWLVSYIEGLLSKVWYSSTVATTTYKVNKLNREFLEKTSDLHPSVADFMLHDFGYRGVSSEESALIGCMSHAICSKGSDTLLAIYGINKYYNKSKNYICPVSSVPATEHNVMISLGEINEPQVLSTILDKFPIGIISVVGDSYDIRRFANEYVGTLFKDIIKNRKGTFVLRPDSVIKNESPANQVVELLDILSDKFGYTINSKGYDILPPFIKVLWGDGLTYNTIQDILNGVEHKGYSTENIATFGMGGGLLQNVTRDTYKFAYKTSAVKFKNKPWQGCSKNPKGTGKVSKSGRLHLIKSEDGDFSTTDNLEEYEDNLQLIFSNGKIFRTHDFENIRSCAFNYLVS